MYKQAIVIRNDLKMSKGKAVAQACHACVGSLANVSKYVKNKWTSEGQKKIVLKANSKKQVLMLSEKCKKYKIPFFLVRDAGMTELRRGTITAIGIGPDKEERINKVTGNLPLLK